MKTWNFRVGVVVGKSGKLMGMAYSLGGNHAPYMVLGWNRHFTEFTVDIGDVGAATFKRAVASAEKQAVANCKGHVEERLRRKTAEFEARCERGIAARLAQEGEG